MDNLQQADLLRRLEAVERKQEDYVGANKIESGFDNINKDVDELEKRIAQIELKIATSEIERTNVASRVGSMEDTQKWIVRLIVGGVLLALLGAVLQGGFSV